MMLLPSDSQRGLFITLEGVEGVGKSTNMAFIADFLRGFGISLVTTREPGGTPLAESMRRLLLDDHSELIDPMAELLMMFAARAQHLNTKILPALSAGQWVLCDRFTDATFAYQGGGRGLPLGVIGKLEHMVQKQWQPDMTIYLDLDVTIGLERARKRGELDRFEREDVEFFEKVRAAYWERVQSQPERFVVVDASCSLDEVQDQIASALRQRVEQRSAGELSEKP